jgi:amidohydrolase
MIAKIKQLAQEFKNDVIGYRHHLHAYPELSFHEFETSKYIQSILSKLPVEVTSNVVNTGIIVLIKGKNPESKTIALRGDIDALPIKEETGLSYSSVNEGIMHACGHDIHTASLLGCAHILSALKNEFEGTIKLIFQPGEELIPGGAKLMIEAGVLENPAVNTMFGQHVFPDLEVGKVGFKSGMYMASADEIYLTIKGKGGHGALPQTIIDPILIASHVITALQQIVSRRSNPATPSVLSFGFIEGKGATNIIPNEVVLKGTFRTFDEAWRKQAHQEIEAMVSGIVCSMGGDFDLEIRVGYPFLTNDETTTQFAKKCAQDYLGDENVVDLSLRMTAEDFAYYSQRVPSCFYRLGTSNHAKGIGGNLHHPKVQFDDDALTIGMGLMSYIALEELVKKQ